MGKGKIRVLVIDDSLFMRTLVSDLLRSDPGVEFVDTARDGAEALEKLSRVKPDCITLDLVMPGQTGLKTLEEIMAQRPTPVIILSAHSSKDAEITMQCLDAGAVGFVLKPSGELSLDVDSVRAELLEKVKAAAAVDAAKLTRHVPRAPRKPSLEPKAGIVVIGSSTGGPQTLEGILYALPPSLGAPLFIVQHMPSMFYTSIFAQRLSKLCRLEVRVAEDGEVVRPDRARLAPGGHQTRVVFDGGQTRTALTEVKPAVLSPGIDITMESAAQVYGENTIGVILSGIGVDGREGMKAIKEAGGRTIVEDESALIFGMPKAVIEAGYADQTLPAGEIAAAIAELTS